ncbi:hypothetical protein HEK616_43600 [Streptomyces nigrescens]|uniref:Uncharacterized protein n=1 Tax=Streptomyces nigrescens TaxID=1920 RepID=A0ABM7ZXC0_STRNI|nr:hypothetical protein HEK616_43600 [Streptomyces nigrescens]
MSGAATISDVFAMTTISRLRQSTSRAHHLRGYGDSGCPVGVATGVDARGPAAGAAAAAAGGGMDAGSRGDTGPPRRWGQGRTGHGSGGGSGNGTHEVAQPCATIRTCTAVCK